MTFAAILLGLWASATFAVAAETPRTFNIEEQALATALNQFARQSDRQILFSTEVVDAKRTDGIKGELEPEAALRKLLKGTGLSFRVTADQTILVDKPGDTANVPVPRNSIRLAQASGSERSPFEGTGEERQTSTASPAQKIDEVVVTGTQIRGAQPSALVLTITQAEMRLSGHANLGEVARALPQNFGGGQNPGIGLGAVGNANYTGSSSLNLRGLGADATLTLLNGARLPYDGTIQATDVSPIPTAAIERIEILLDGASAIYGSDAVGGVANIILRRDYEGAEVSARYGTATDGGFDQQQYTAVGGTNWGSGGFLVTADYSQNTDVRARQRAYLSSMPNQNVTIYPEMSQRGALLSGHQDIGTAELTLDAFYTDRRTADLGQTVTIFDTQRDAIIWGVSPALRFGLPAQWSLRLHGAAGSNENTQTLRTFNPATGAELPNTSPVTTFLNETESADVGLEGPLFALPGGQARLSLGGGYRRTTFDQTRVTTGVTVVSGEASSSHGYAEVNLPLVTRLSFDGALRQESHKTFGNVTTPKAALIWNINSGLDVKASWGKSFKAPTLNQQFVAAQMFHYPGSAFRGLPPASTVLWATGGNAALEPERAEVLTAGLVATPQFLPGFSLEVGWFDIDYVNRVIQPPVAQLLNPAFAEFFTFNPTLAQQQAFFSSAGVPFGTFTSNIAGAYDPANISVLLDSRHTNAAVDEVNGVDLIARYAIDAFGGRMSFNANGSWIDAKRQITSAAPDLQASGAIFFPAKFKGRLGASWSRAGLTLSSAVNYIDGVKNTNVTPNPQVGSMTTVDLVGDYWMESGPLGQTGFNIAVANLLDRHPARMRPAQTFYPPYDSTNYSALGRTVSVTITTRFQ